jgi:hypothetical protein
MVCPEVLAIKSQRPALKGHSRQFFDTRGPFPRIEPGQAPISFVLFRPAQNVDYSINKNMAAYLSADCNFAGNIS